MEWNEVEELLKADESEYIERKRKAFLKNSNKVGAQLTSFANRNGGRILVGVENSGELEGVTFDKDETLLTITNIVQSKCSPPIMFSTDYVTSKKGEVLVITVEKRKEMPHALVNRSGRHIKSRTYYIRQKNRKMLVDDQLLRVLFTHTDDPKIFFDFDMKIQYLRTNPRVHPVPRHRIFSPIYNFISYIHQLNDDDVKYLLQDESNRSRAFYVELLPYAMLGYLSHVFSSSWLVNVDRRVGRTTVSPIKTDQKVVHRKEIPSPPKSSVLSQLSVSFEEVFKSMFFKLALPIKTEVKLGFDKNKSSLSFINDDAFRFDFTFIGGSWRRGPSVPPSAYGVLDRFDDQYAFQNEMGTITLNCNFSGTFKYPKIDESFTDHHKWGLTIRDFLQRDWDWKAYLDTLPDDIMFSIENYCKKILDILETKKKNT